MTRLRTALILVACLGAGAAPALAQTADDQGEFSYSPAAQERGQSVQISGKCVNAGTTTGVTMRVAVEYGANGDDASGYRFPDSTFAPAANGTVTGSIAVPGDAPYGDYLITGECRNGNQPFFTKNGPFAVVLQASSTTTAPRATTTTVLRSTTTTSTTAVPETTTTSTTGVVATTLPASIEDEEETTTTEVDSFAGTRKDDDGSIGPLVVLLGIVPLVGAIAAIALAMRRQRTAGPPVG